VNAAETCDCLVNADACCAEEILSGVEVNTKADIAAPSRGILSIWLDKVAASDSLSLPTLRKRLPNCGPFAVNVRTRKSKTAS
jgi:hypothetical protein